MERLKQDIKAQKLYLESRLRDCHVKVNLDDYESVEELENYVDKNHLCQEEVTCYENAIGLHEDSLTPSELKTRKNEEEFDEVLNLIEDYYYDVEDLKQLEERKKNEK